MGKRESLCFLQHIYNITDLYSYIISSPDDSRSRWKYVELPRFIVTEGRLEKYRMLSFDFGQVLPSDNSPNKNLR
jgi:hypothetical protein